MSNENSSKLNNDNIQLSDSYTIRTARIRIRQSYRRNLKKDRLQLRLVSV